MKFLVQNYSCLQNPWLGAYRPQIPVLSVLCPQLNLLNPPPRTKFLGTPLRRSSFGFVQIGSEPVTLNLNPRFQYFLADIAEIRYSRTPHNASVSFMQVRTVSTMFYPCSLNKTSPYFVHSSSSLDKFLDKAIDWPRITWKIDARKAIL